MQAATIANENHIARHIKKVWIVESEGVISIIPQAFEITDNDDGYLSANWLEYFAGTHLDQLSQIVTTTSSRTFSKSSGFTVGNIGKIKACCEKYGHQVRVVHEYSEDCPSYAALKRYGNNLEMCQELSETHWNDLTLVSQLPKIP